MNTPTHKLGQAMQHMVECGKRPCFRIDGLRITIASIASANPGALYIKTDNWDYIGKVTADGTMKIMHPSHITDKQKILVLAAITDPEGTAMSNGKATGTCCCCGRTLTNKFSIELGIGPICRGFWFPGHTSEATVETPIDLGINLETEVAISNELISKEPIEHTTVREMIDHQESKDVKPLVLSGNMMQIDFNEEPSDADITVANMELDSLESDLGSIATVSEPTAVELVIIYKSLNAKQKHIFLGMIKHELVQ